MIGDGVIDHALFSPALFSHGLPLLVMRPLGRYGIQDDDDDDNENESDVEDEDSDDFADITL